MNNPNEISGLIFDINGKTLSQREEKLESRVRILEEQMKALNDKGRVPATFVAMLYSVCTEPWTFRTGSKVFLLIVMPIGVVVLIIVMHLNWLPAALEFMIWIIRKIV